jgi:hypothetical protein
MTWIIIKNNFNNFEKKRKEKNTQMPKRCVAISFPVSQISHYLKISVVFTSLNTPTLLVAILKKIQLKNSTQPRPHPCLLFSRPSPLSPHITTQNPLLPITLNIFYFT